MAEARIDHRDLDPLCWYDRRRWACLPELIGTESKLDHPSKRTADAA
jgi:hypothetical protein